MKNIIALLVLLVITTLSLSAQSLKIIKLKQQKITYQPKTFHIVSVHDDRADTTNIGTARFGIMNKKMKADLDGGTTDAITSFLQKNLVQDTGNTPISMHITKLEISEKKVGLREQVNIDITITFYEGDKKLIEYSGNGYQQSGLDAAMYMEHLIRDRVEDCIKEFDKWWEENKSMYEAKASVKVIPSISAVTDDSDELAYSKRRPLKLDDFKGEVEDLSKAAAATYSGILVEANTESRNGQVTVTVSITPYFDRTKSWCRSYAHDAKTLAHEQLHFDITAIKSCELAHKMESAIFTVENYSKEIEQLRKQCEKEWQQMQDDYDKETKHGTIPAMQQQWATKIKQQLADATCY